MFLDPKFDLAPIQDQNLVQVLIWAQKLVLPYVCFRVGISWPTVRFWSSSLNMANISF